MRQWTRQSFVQIIRRQAIIWTNAGILLIGALGSKVKLQSGWRDFYSRNAFEDVMYETAAILSQPLCVSVLCLSFPQTNNIVVGLTLAQRWYCRPVSPSYIALWTSSTWRLTVGHSAFRQGRCPFGADTDHVGMLISCIYPSSSAWCLITTLRPQAQAMGRLAYLELISSVKEATGGPLPKSNQLTTCIYPSSCTWCLIARPQPSAMGLSAQDIAWLVLLPMAFLVLLGTVSILRCRLTSIGIPMLKIRRSHDRLIFNMGILISGRDSFYI